MKCIYSVILPFLALSCTDLGGKLQCPSPWEGAWNMHFCHLPLQGAGVAHDLLGPKGSLPFLEVASEAGMTFGVPLTLVTPFSAIISHL